MSTWIPSAEAFGIPRVVQVVGVLGIASGEAFGTPTVTSSSLTTIVVSGIPSAEAVGTPTVVQVVSPTGIPSGEVVPAPTAKTTVTEFLASGQVVGTGNLLIGQRVGSGAVLGTGTLVGAAVRVRNASGAVRGTGDFLWSGPLPFRGVGLLSGFAQVVRPPPPVCGCHAPPVKSFGYLQTLGKCDLVLCIRDAYGNNVSPLKITYAVYQVLRGGYRQLRGPAERTPIMTPEGCYYAPLVAGECGQPGDWCVVWSWQRNRGFPCESQTECFKVLDQAMLHPCDPNRKQKFGWGC